MITPMPIAYSYARYSSGRQSSGITLERQVKAARAYVDAIEGLTLDTTLTLHDLGVSAFSGRNLGPLGKLGKFIEAVDKGQIAQGSYLLIESFDRFSRLPPMDALDKLREITKKGIVVVTLMDGIAYSEKSISENWTSLIIALASMERSNDESKSKSKRSISNWQEKNEKARETRIPRGNTAPRWLIYTPERYVINEDRAATVKQVYQWALDGYGRTIITRMLNERGIQSFKGTTWGSSSVQLLLTNPAVMGTYQPHSNARGEPRKPIGEPIEGYYPEIITPTLYYAVQNATKTRRITKSTKQSASFNVWQGIAHCYKCGSTFHLSNKGRHSYLQCHGSRKGICDAKSVRLDASEKVLPEILAKVGDKSLTQASSASQAQQLQAAQNKLLIEQKRYVNTQLIQEDEPTHAGARALKKQESTIESLQNEIANINSALASDTILDIDAFFGKLNTVLSNYEGRAQTNSLLKRRKINVLIDAGHPEIGIAYIVIQDENPMIGFIVQPGKVIWPTPLNMEQLEKMKAQGNHTPEHLKFAEAIMPIWKNNISALLGKGAALKVHLKKD